MFEFIKKHKLILFIFAFILFWLINTNDVSATTYTFKDNTYYCAFPNSIFEIVQTLNEWNDSNYACIGYQKDKGDYYIGFIKNLNSSCSCNNGSWGLDIYFPSIRPIILYRYNNQGVLQEKKNITSSSRYYDASSTAICLFKNITVDDNCSNLGGAVKSEYIKNFITFPEISIEFNENTNSYWVWTDWYDVRNISLDNFYAYGKYTDIDINNPDECWQWSLFKYEYKENEEGKRTITREGFELWRYGYYSYCLFNANTGDWIIKGIDWTEESLKGTEYEDCLNPFTNLNLYLDDNISPPTVYSNFIEKELLEKCNLVEFSVSFDNGESFSSVYIECKEERIAEGITYVRFYYKLFANDTYTFKLCIFDENYTSYEIVKTFTINSFEEIVDINGTNTVPASPFITAYSDSEIIRFSTQTFKERVTLDIMGDVDTLRYTAYYIDYDAYQLFGDNYEDWILMDVGYEDYDKVIQGYPYYFKTEFGFDTLEDGDIFYFIFYDNKLGCFSQVTTYTLESKSDLYTISQNITFNNDKFQRLYNFFNEHFGFLTYPFEFIINLLTRIFNINYEEPVLHFPQIINPLDNTVIFNGFDYNFNSILEYEGIAYFYNIYLIAVDFIFVVAFIFGCKHTIEEVFGNG